MSEIQKSTSTASETSNIRTASTVIRKYNVCAHVCNCQIEIKLFTHKRK